MQDLKALDKYPWTGHSTILGRRENPLLHTDLAKGGSSADLSDSPTAEQWWAEGELSFSFSSGKGKKKKDPSNPVDPVQKRSLAEKTIEDLLLHFGETKKVARRRYRQFVKSGIEQGRRPEFQGGGLIRSAGGNKAGLLGRRKEERPACHRLALAGRLQSIADREKGDARVLGSGDFVNEAVRQAEVKFEKKYLPKRPIEELLEIVASNLNLNAISSISASRKKEISEARALICHFAINDLSYSASEVASSLAISRVNASRCAVRGKKVLDRYQDLKDIVQ